MARELLMAAHCLPVVDLALAFGWGWSVHRSWRGPRNAAPTDLTAEERGLGAAVIMGQLNAVITGASILLAGIGAFVAVGTNTLPSPNYNLFYAALWAVIALGVALYALSTLPTRTLRENFVQSHPVALFCAMSLFFSLAAGVRLLLAVGGILLSPADTVPVLGSQNC